MSDLMKAIGDAVDSANRAYDDAVDKAAKRASREADAIFDIRDIPVIMRAKGWSRAAMLQDKWFSRPASIYPPGGTPDTTTITMQWLLGFARARTMYAGIVSDERWKNPAAQAQLRKRIEAQKILVGNAPVRFGNLGQAVDILDREHYQSITVSGSKWERLTDDLDDLYGALGVYGIHFAAAGTATPNDDGSWTVTVEQVGIYVKDKYDFNDALQPLGCWSKSLSDVRIAGSPPDYVPVFNGNYQLWRRANGRGGDFDVYSDVMIMPEAKPWTMRMDGVPGATAPPPPPAPSLFPETSPRPAPDLAPPPPRNTRVTVRSGDSLSGLAATHYGDWRLWPLIWDQNRAEVGPLPSVLKPGTVLTLAPADGFSEAVRNGARKRAPKWKNNEF